MMTRLASLADRRARRILIFAGVLFVLGGAFGAGVASRLDPYGADDPQTESVIANIYACEALFRAGISPTRLAGTLATKTGKPTKAIEALVKAVKAVLGEAIKAGGSSLRDYARADGRLGRFQHSFKVYGREGKPCRKKGCRGTVRRIVQSGRSTFYCPNCQR